MTYLTGITNIFKISKKKIDHFYKVVFLLIFVISMSSCIDQPYYEKNLSIDPSGWQINDSIIFTFDIDDTLSPMNFLLNIRHSTEYNYSNIYLFINSIYPNGQTNRDTVEILLAAKDGKWYGTGLGKLKESQILLKHNLIFPFSGTYEFSLVQAMREQNLKGIEDVGIRIEKSEFAAP